MAVKIAIIGASEQQNPLILKAKEKGYETHTFSWHDGREIGKESSDYFYPISATNKEEILSKCREIGIVAVASIGSDISALAAAYVAENMGLVGNRYEAVKCATNKLLTRKKLAQRGIPQPKFVEIGDAVSFDDLNDMKYPLVVKPSDRSGSKGIRVIHSEDEFFGAINEARDLSFERKAIVEEYISGTAYSCECVSVNGRHRIVGFTKRDVAIIKGHPCEHRHLQPAIIPCSIIDKLNREINELFDALGIVSGVSSVEFIIDPNNEVFFIEVSPYLYGDYIGTHLVPIVYGVDLTAITLDIALDRQFELSVQNIHTSATVEFDYSESDGERRGHTITKYPIKEFGGCPELRIKKLRSYYAEDDNTVALNSEYTAFWYALNLISSNRIHMPYYSSSTWGRIAEQAQYQVVYYHINSDFCPIDLSVNDGDAVLLINYHGLCDDYIKNAKFKNKIIDNSMSFFCEPIMEDGTYNIYSCRKFFAVADGAYLISKSINASNKLELERDVSYKRYVALMKSLELGAGAAYKEQQTNEQELAKQRYKMSVLTEKMLSALDYEAEDLSRKINFERLHSSLSKYNLLQIKKTPDHAPQFYPLLVNADIRNMLIGKKIYIPLMWRSTLSKEFNGFDEKWLSEKLICLPISSDYSQKDMDYLIETVIASIT